MFIVCFSRGERHHHRSMKKFSGKPFRPPCNDPVWHTAFGTSKNYRQRVQVLSSRKVWVWGWGLPPVVGVQPAEPIDLAGTQGFEPRYADPESAVLPLDDVPVNLYFSRG